jgi:hypothetical protein
VTLLALRAVPLIIGENPRNPQLKEITLNFTQSATIFNNKNTEKD